MKRTNKVRYQPVLWYPCIRHGSVCVSREDAMENLRELTNNNIQYGSVRELYGDSQIEQAVTLALMSRKIWTSREDNDK
jgi:hypothetical protein